jgi:hypothetical protein
MLIRRNTGQRRRVIHLSTGSRHQLGPASYRCRPAIYG